MEENEILEFDLEQQNQGVRTGMLTTASVLSWIMGGLMVLTCGIMLLVKGKIVEILKEAAPNFDAQQRAAVDLMMAHFNQIFLVNFIAYAISIFSVVLMFRLKKVGFYIYAPLHIAITFYPYTYQPFVLDGGVIFNIIVLGTFIAFYGVNLKHMK
ncbi:MAG: hypothetical protein H6598_10390 [Flavobacteriales bacterium]|nr:hypothetical protein [Flavobacteriales bacterium]